MSIDSRKDHGYSCLCDSCSFWRDIDIEKAIDRAREYHEEAEDEE